MDEELPENQPKFFKATINPELTSRGIGEKVPLKDATVFDFMPRLLGSRFMADEDLTAHIYPNEIHMDLSGSAIEELYTELAWTELKAGNMTGALAAYRQALYPGLMLIQAVQKTQENMLLTENELNRLRLEGKFGRLEQELVEAVEEQEVAFDQKKYSDFIRTIRDNKKRRIELRKSVKTPEMQKEYLDLCVVMGDFDEAADVAERLGDSALANEYTAKARMTKDNPKMLEIKARLLKKYDKGD